MESEVITVNIGAVLRTARKRSGLTQEELAARLHRSNSCISKYESNSLTIDVPTFVKWAKLTNAQDLLIAAMLSVDPSVVAEGLRVMSQLIGGIIAWTILLT